MTLLLESAFDRLETRTTATTYQTLGSATSTRLIILLPGAGGSPICVDLEEVDLLQCPEYEAVSYTWGDVDDEQTINIAGRLVQIRNNLHAFLLRLRHHTRTRALWIDAISISQEDLDEKSRQVAMIGSIFSQAERVLVWLGEHANRSEVLFQEDMPLQTPDDKCSLKSTQYLDRAEPDPQSRAVIWAHFFDRRYFSRVWVVQEILLARSVLVHCGDDQKSWHELITCRWPQDARISLYDREFDGIPQSVSEDAATSRRPDRRVNIGSGDADFYEQTLSRVVDIEQWRSKTDGQFADKTDTGGSYTHSYPSSMYMYWDTRGTEVAPETDWPPDLMATVQHWTHVSASGCQDPRDAVYALLSLSNEPSALIPDYTIGMPELFLKVYKDHYSKIKDFSDDLHYVAEAYRGTTLLTCLRLSQPETGQVVQRLFRKRIVHPHGGSNLLYAAPILIAAEYNRDRRRLSIPELKQAMWPGLLADVRATAVKLAIQISLR